MTERRTRPITRATVYVVNKLWLLLAASIILLALLFTLLRLFLPQISHFKNEIQSWVEEHYRIEVDVAELGARWGSAGPIIELKDVHIKSQQGLASLISIDAMTISLDGLGTLLSGQIVTDKIEIQGANLNFLLDRQLGVQIDPLEDNQRTPEIQATSQIIISQLFNQKNLSLTQSKISLETLSGRQFNYDIDKLDITNFDRIHQIKGKLSDEFHGELNLVAEITGDPATEKSETHFYLDGKNIQIPQLPGIDKLPAFSPKSGALHWRLWSDWSNGRWQNAIGELEVIEVDWQIAQQKSATGISTEISDDNPQLPASIEKLSFNFDWEFTGKKNGQLTFYQGQLKRKENSIINLPNVVLLFTQKNKLDIQWDILTNELKLDPFVSYLGLNVGSKIDPSSANEATNLTLNIQSFGTRLKRENNHWLAPVIVTYFDQLDYSALTDFPVMTGLSGKVSYINQQASINLNAEEAQFNYGDLFRDTLNFDEVNIQLNLSLDQNEQLNINISSAQFSNKDLALSARSRFFFQDNEAHLYLLAELSRLDISQKSKYLPSGIMSEHLVSYLDTSVIAGEIPRAMAIVRGPLTQFPFDSVDVAAGIFSIKALAEKTNYQYLADWPIANNLKVDMSFEGNGMTLHALAGDSMSIAVNSAKAQVKDFSVDNPILELTIDADSFDNQGQQFLSNTPLKNLAESLEPLNYSGKIATLIDLKIGLSDSSDIRLQGRVIPERVSAQLDLSGFIFKQIDGILKFSELGIEPSQLSAKYRGKPLKGKIYSGKNADQAELTIDVAGIFPASGIADAVSDNWTELINGESAFSGRVEVGPIQQRNSVSMEFTSDLEGISLVLPGEFNKLKAQVEPLSVKIQLAETSDIQIDWKNTQSKWWWKILDGNYQHQGGVFLAGSDLSLPTKAPQRYSGDIQLGEIALQDWQLVYDKVMLEVGHVKQKLVTPVELTLQIKRLINPMFDITDVTTKIIKNNDGNWRINAKSNSGNFDLRMSELSPWELAVDDLNLVLSAEYLESLDVESAQLEVSAADIMQTDGDHLLNDVVEKPENLTLQYFETIDFSQLPRINVSCLNCKVHDVALGDIQINLKATSENLNVKGVMRDQKRHQLIFDTNWQKKLVSTNETVQLTDDEKRFSHSTNIEYQLHSDNFGELLKRWKYPLGIEDSSGKVSGRLSWDNSPWMFAAKDIEGGASIQLGKGSLNDISDAKARLFSLFSLQSLTRRLQLDFSDVYKKGFFYDKLSGDINLHNGIAQSNNIFVDGSAAKVNVSGAFDLRSQTIEQRALVVPHLTSSLPVLIGWAVEPTTGILIFLLNKIFEPAIEVVTQIEYRIHGGISDIQVDEIKKSQSKVKYDVDQVPLDATLLNAIELNVEKEKPVLPDDSPSSINSSKLDSQ